METATPLPNLWLFSDVRNDAMLEDALARLPSGNALIFRHYHLAPAARQTRFEALSTLAKSLGHMIILSDDAALARAWGADGIYGPAERVAGAQGLLRLATAHNAQEIEQAHEANAHGIFLSPVFPTRSHEGTQTLGIKRFQALAATSQIPVIALGGMTAERAKELGWPRWGAIDGLS